MKFLDLFAGIGGFRRGLELAGHQCVGFCEFDTFATASYTSMHLITDIQREELKEIPKNKRQKEILKDEYRNGEWYASDIRNVHASELPGADCWCFGAPCQDFSISGKRKGLDGERSSLVREVFRILEEFQEKDRPEWLIYENVKGMLSSNSGLDYLSILSEMDRLGYDIEWQNINSRWFVPQNRERIYTVGHLRRYGSAKILPIEGANRENSASINERKYPCFVDMNYGAGIKTTEAARALQSRYYKGVSSRNGEVSGVAVKAYNSDTIAIRKLTPKECFRLQGWDDDYFERAAMVCSDTQLYKQAGNGVTVPVVEAIGKEIAKHERKSV